MIRIDNVSHSYGAAGVLHDLTLEVPKGCVTALIGPNGAGKSTLLSLIARLMPLQSGEISVDDMLLGTTDSTELARRLAILPQASDIAPRLTVEQLVGFGRFPHSRGRPSIACLAKIEEALVRFELIGLRDRLLDTLSGGQRQRALIAMAFAQDTDYLLLDEPLNNLDIAASRSLMRLLRDMVTTDGKTVLIVLHDINYASAYAEHIVVLAEGALVAQGTPQEVVTEALLAKAFQTDASVGSHADRPVVFP
ncbi:MAG: ATP-binding cassette domain-containing protein [Pseudomonadota bacterium]